MAHILETIRKRSVFVYLKKFGKFKRTKTFNLQYINNEKLDDKILVGFTATKKLGNAIKRNRAKRIMRELARNIISQYGKSNSYYVLIAKSQIFDIPFEIQKNELIKILK